MRTQILLAITMLLMLIAQGYGDNNNAATDDPEFRVPSPKLGHYVPELHGSTLGRYVPDESGKYRHQHKPYDGGYGDSGTPYEFDLRGLVQQLQDQEDANYGRRVKIIAPTPGNFDLGPKDHLRFMIDFNYNGTGWQIIQFEWLRDGDEDKRYNYVNENQLWEGQESIKPYDYVKPLNSANDASEGIAEEQQEPSQSTASETQVHVEGDYSQDQNSYHVDYSNDPDHKTHGKDVNNIQETIYEVLEYIQNKILPTIK